MGSTWGNTIKISIFGESHGTGIGVVIDGFPSGVMYDEAFVLREMERRAPGRNKQSTARKEPDRPEIQSGIYNGKTTGTPICAVIRNTNQRSNDYAELAAQPRPGHADYTGMLRYDSCNDPRGGGHFSGRLTAPLVFAGRFTHPVHRADSGYAVRRCRSHRRAAGCAAERRISGEQSACARGHAGRYRGSA